MPRTAQNHEKHYSEASFWAKVKKCVRVVDRRAIKQALTSHYAFLDPEVPAWAKAVCAGALGYLIFPLDAIPDTLGPLGYVDDVGVMAAALAAVALQLTPATKARAAETLAQCLARIDGAVVP